MKNNSKKTTIISQPLKEYSKTPDNKRRKFLKTSLLAGGVLGGSMFGGNLLSPLKAKTPNPIIPQESPKPSIEQNLLEFQSNAPISAKGYAAFGKEWKFHPYNFMRHSVGDNDVLIEILYAGICHSDLHTIKGEHGPANHPMIPGHEIAGRIVAVGSKVRKFKVGDYAGVGCMVNSCGECETCKRSEEQFCTRGQTVFTYNSKDVFHNGEISQGGYSSNIVLSEKFAFKLPKNVAIEKVAPLLCAGITTYSPIKYSKVKKGQKVAVAGLGGLGHMAAKYMVALGAEVSAFDILDKSKEAQKLGIKHFIQVDSQEFNTLSNKFDFIISTIPYQYDINAYHKMLKMYGELAIVGLPSHEDNPKLDANAMIWGFKRKIYSSLIGGVSQTQEMLDYSIKNNIYPEVEIIPIQKLEEAYKKVAAGEANFRYVIDMKSLS